MPKISVVISLYNKERYIKRCIDSVLNQTFTDFEVVVVDDASTDNSVQVIKDNFNDKRIKIVSRENGGPAAARNTGIKAATGEWIVFLDADDVFLPNALKTFADLIEKHADESYIICNYFLGYGDSYTLFTQKHSDKKVIEPFKWEFMGMLSDRPGSAIYKRELLLRHFFNEKLRRFEDAESQYDILREVKPYQCSAPVMISFRDASEAASCRKDINEDFVGHLKFEGKSFWENMMLYKLLCGAIHGYGEQATTLYPHIINSKIFKIQYFIARTYSRLLRPRGQHKTFTFKDTQKY